VVKVEPSPPSLGAESTELDQTQESRDSTETLPFRQVKKSFQAKIAPLVWFRKIRMFFGLPDPNPLVRGTLALIRIRIRLLPFSHKGVERTEIMLAKSNFNTKFILKAID
jgi:hypothetical protein